MEEMSTDCYDRSMTAPDREIPQRELRNDVSSVLEEVASGARIRVTVHGKPVADLVPVSSARAFVPRAEVEDIIATAPLDPAFAQDVARALSQTVDEL